MKEIYDIGWSTKAGKDLQKIKQYLIENASERVADTTLRGIITVVQLLSEQPERYPVYAKLKKYGNFRHILKWNYRIIYEFTDHQIFVHRVIHTKRNMKKITVDR